jgi:hypothetical protein
MSRFRDNSSSAVNFFFLLDIFTCTLGVMILITLHYSHNAKMRPRPENLRAPTEAEETEILKPGEEPPEVKLSRLSDLLFWLNSSNKNLKSKIDWAAALPSLVTQTNLAHRLKLENASLIVKTNLLTREIEASLDDINRMLAALGVTNYTERIAMLEEKLANVALRTREYELTNTALRAAIDYATRHPRMLYVPKSDKTPIVVTVSGGEVSVELFGDANSKRSLLGNVTNAAFVEALAGFKSASNYVVFFVRPSGIRSYVRLATAAKSAGYEIGGDGIEENLALLFSPKG